MLLRGRPLTSLLQHTRQVKARSPWLRAAILSAKTDLSYSLIKAPFTGRIGISQVKLGAQVSPGTTLLNTISSEHPVGVDVVINEQDIDRFYKYQKSSTDSTFRLQLADGSNYNQSGKVLAIDRGVASGTGTIKGTYPILKQRRFIERRDELRFKGA